MSIATTYNFDSVGDTLPTLREHEKVRFESTEIVFNPRTPLKLSKESTEFFVMNKKLADAAADNLKNLILTNRGERVMQPSFGANLKSILAEFATDGFQNEVMRRIKQSVNRFLPYVALNTMQMEQVPQPSSSGLIVINFIIGYSIPSASINNENITVTLSTIA